jgi:hypothetical protein
MQPQGVVASLAHSYAVVTKAAVAVGERNLLVRKSATTIQKTDDALRFIKI